MEDIIAIIGVFTCGSLAVIAFSPIGKAIAEGMRAKRGLIPNEEVEDLRAELQGVREQLSEMAERQDFAERLLAQQRDKGLAPPRDPAS